MRADCLQNLPRQAMVGKGGGPLPPDGQKARGSHQGSRIEAATGYILTWAQSGRCCPSAHHPETPLLPPIPIGVTPIQAVTSQMPKGRQGFNLPSTPQTFPLTPTRALFPSSQVRHPQAKRLKRLASSMTEVGTRTKASVFLFLNIQCFTQNEGLVVLG